MRVDEAHARRHTVRAAGRRHEAQDPSPSACVLTAAAWLGVACSSTSRAGARRPTAAGDGERARRRRGRSDVVYERCRTTAFLHRRSRAFPSTRRSSPTASTCRAALRRRRDADQRRAVRVGLRGAQPRRLRPQLHPAEPCTSSTSAATIPIPITDLFGFGTAVESYEYSKYYMNMEIQESTAGVSLANGPIVAHAARAPRRSTASARGCRTCSPTPAPTSAATPRCPRPTNNDQNYLGFPGQWPSYPAVHGLGPDDGRRRSRSCSRAPTRAATAGLGFGHDDRSALRVRLQHDAPAEPRPAGRQGARPGGARPRDVEGGHLGDRLRRPRPRHVQ